MPILRLAYATQFLIALIAVFVLWSQVGGQSHLDLMPWYLKLCLGAGAAFAAVRASAAARFVLRALVLTALLAGVAGPPEFREVLEHAPPGVFDARSWAYWNLKCQRVPAPPLPRRQGVQP